MWRNINIGLTILKKIEKKKQPKSQCSSTAASIFLFFSTNLYKEVNILVI